MGAEKGHNLAGAQIKQYVERVERLEEERASLSEDIKDVLGEADAMGFDKKIIKLIVKVRKNKREFIEDMQQLEIYMHAMNDQLCLDFGGTAVAAKDA